MILQYGILLLTCIEWFCCGS